MEMIKMRKSNIPISWSETFTRRPDVWVGTSVDLTKSLPTICFFPTAYFVSHTPLGKCRYGHCHSKYAIGDVIQGWYSLIDVSYIIILVRYATESAEVRQGWRLAFWRHDCRRHARKTCRRRPNDRTTATCCGTHSRARSTIQNNFWQRKSVNVNLSVGKRK